MVPPDDSPPAEPLRLEVLADRTGETLDPELRAGLTSHSVVRTQYAHTDLWLVARDVLEKDAPPDEQGPGGDPGAPFRAILHDLAGSEVIEVHGYLGDPDSLRVLATNRSRLPNDEEDAWAGDVLRLDAEFSRRMDVGEITLYRPIPPLASVQTADGTVDRIVTVGVREATEAGVRHRVVGIRTADGEVIEEGPGLASGEGECGLPDGDDAPDESADNQARVRVWRGDELLWDLLVVRPRASSGVNGSGVELRTVDYQGARVLLHRAHVPILNVAYDEGAAPGCGPTSRNWLNEEACFEADAAAQGEGDGEGDGGFRVLEPPRTILESGQGGGNFRGVALCLQGDELLIVSQLQAGWHRYASEWRLAADGTIKPRFGFAAARNPCTCSPHVHHAYWRFDFDITSSELNLVQEHNSPTLPGQLSPWHTIRYEVQRPRDPDRQRRWRVRTVRSPHGYTVVPGPDDGTADHYGAGDVWILVYDGVEIDDDQGFTTDPALSRAQLDRFLSGEIVERQDVVLWYGAHFAPPPESDGPGHRVGPDLEPFNWKPITERGPYIPLAPPVQNDPDDEDPGPAPSAVE